MLYHQNAETITESIKKELFKSGLDSQKFSSLASEGASVMVGKNRGVSPLLKRENPRLTFTVFAIDYPWSMV